MPLSIFAVLFALGCLQQAATLPSMLVCRLVAASALLLWCCAAYLHYHTLCHANGNARVCKTDTQKRLLSLPTLLTAIACGFAAFAWGALRAHERLHESLATNLMNQDVVVMGHVAVMPQHVTQGLRFAFDVEQAHRLDGTPVTGVPSRISLGWYGVSNVAAARGDGGTQNVVSPHAGEHWQFKVRLRPPHANLNPHGFDFEAWLFERGIRATGYVRELGQSPENTLLQPTTSGALDLGVRLRTVSYLIEHWREQIRDNIDQDLPEQPWSGVLMALTVGDQQAISTAQWQLFQQTGLTHLMSISGLHITMVAGLFGWLCAAIWRRIPAVANRVPAQRVAAIAAVVSALLYCLVSGFAVPAQRTFIMLCVAAFCILLGRRVAITTVLCWALLLVLLFDPFAVSSAGFWLSFGAVAFLLWISVGRVSVQSSWRGRSIAAGRMWLRAQIIMMLGLLPVLLVLFQQFSVVSPIANAIAIPIVSWIITPLALLAAMLSTFINVGALWQLLHGLVSALMLGVQWLASLPFAVWQQAAPPMVLLLLALPGVLWLFMPRGTPLRWLGLMGLLPMLLWQPERPAMGELQMTVLDVGQGLAVHIRTAKHDMLYDTGPMYSTEADAGQRIVVPYLRAEGVHDLDMLMVTHQDRDHAGGALSVIHAVPVATSRSSLASDDPILPHMPNHKMCMAGEHWQWDGVDFLVLHPAAGEGGRHDLKTNAQSCVLRVATAQQVVLLTADIEAASELALMQNPWVTQNHLLKADVLLVPHHGSLTSSLPEFVDAVSPQYAVFAVGYFNRFAHPRPAIWDRYAQTTRLRTDWQGAIRLNVSARDIEVSNWRQREVRYWHDHAPSALNALPHE